MPEPKLYTFSTHIGAAWVSLVSGGHLDEDVVAQGEERNKEAKVKK
jgi:hypothetical protein